MFADSGKAVAMMANSDNGISVMNLLMQSVAKEYGWKYTPDVVSATDVLTTIAKLKGADAALAKYAQLKKAGAAGIDETTLIGVGYTFLFSGQIEPAVQVFTQEVQDYPKYWNAYDSLGEAYLKGGQKDLAIQNYEKSIELNPKNDSGVEHLKQLREQK
jgi:tetratricopeptide (TPR) repeat protein